MAYEIRFLKDTKCKVGLTESTSGLSDTHILKGTVIVTELKPAEGNTVCFFSSKSRGNKRKHVWYLEVPNSNLKIIEASTR